MPFLFGIALIFVAVVVLFWLTSKILQMALMLVMAGIIGWLADKIVPGRLPYGPVGLIVAGLVGSGLGTIIMGDLGPLVFGIPVIPAFVGAVIVTAVISLLGPLIGGKKPRNLPTRWSEP